MQTALRSSAFALAAAAWPFAAVASAHLHAPISFVSVNNSRDHSHVFGAQPRLGAAMDISGSFSGARSDHQAAAIPVALVHDLPPAVEISTLSALLGGRFTWIPAPIIDMFDAFQFESFDPKTGDYGVYAEVAPRTSRDSAAR